MGRATSAAGAPGGPAPGMRGSFPTVQLEQREFERLRRLIHEETGISLAPSKRVLLESRLARRLRALQLDSFAAYCAHLDAHLDDERVPLINCVTTNKTEFFREAHHFEFLRSQLLPAIEARAARTGRRRLRIWSAGCSTGEEPYSLALTLLEWLEHRPGWDVRLLASDIDTNVLEAASRAHYPDERLEDVPLPWRRRWFRALPGRPGWSEADSALRELIAFRRINLNDQPWPIRTTFDLILCRNVIIYFNRTTQTRLLERFAGLLEPDGHLIIGHSESLAWLSDTFTAVRGQPTVYTLASRQARGERVPDAGRIEGLSQPHLQPQPQRQTHMQLPPPPHPQSHPQRTAAATGVAPRAQKPHDAPVGALTTGAPTTHALTTDAGVHASGGERASARGADGVPRTLALGEMRVSADGDVLRVLLESAAGVAIFDPEAHAGGLLSLLLSPSPLPSSSLLVPSPVSVAVSAGDAGRMPFLPRPDAGADTVVAGERALTDLIAAIIEAGGRRERLRAKLVGGASRAGEAPSGEARLAEARPGEAAAPDAASRTLACVRRLLEREAVPIVSERTGGATPIELLFHTDSGRARVRDLPLADRPGVTARELAAIDPVAADLPAANASSAAKAAKARESMAATAIMPASCRDTDRALAGDTNMRVAAAGTAAGIAAGEPAPHARTGEAD